MGFERLSDRFLLLEESISFLNAIIYEEKGLQYRSSVVLHTSSCFGLSIIFFIPLMRLTIWGLAISDDF